MGTTYIGGWPSLAFVPSRAVCVPAPRSTVVDAPVFIPAIVRVAVTRSRLRIARREPERSRGVDAATLLRRYETEARGLYRVFNTAAYRLYRSQSRPPREGDEPFATTSSLPYEPGDTFGDGIWYLSVSYFNGVIDSGFLPLGPAGETYLRLEIVSGDEVYAPPYGPGGWSLSNVGGGVVRIVGYYRQRGGLRAGQWSIAYTTDGTDPPADQPDVTVTIVPEGLAALEYDLPAQSDGTTVKVRLQTRRLDGATWRYSEDSEIKTIEVEATGGGEAAAPLDASSWVGRLPEYK
jgi:hypothetical protein